MYLQGMGELAPGDNCNGANEPVEGGGGGALEMAASFFVDCSEPADQGGRVELLVNVPLLPFFLSRNNNRHFLVRFFTSVEEADF